MKLSKFKIEIVIVVVLLCVVSGVWWFIATKNERATATEIKMMVDYAQRQALEIAIIEQASKLTDYRKQLARARQPKPVKTPIPVLPTLPETADPKDVNDSR